MSRASPALPPARIASYYYHRNRESFSALVSLSLPMIFLILFITGQIMFDELRKDKRYRLGDRPRKPRRARSAVIIAPRASA